MVAALISPIALASSCQNNSTKNEISDAELSKITTDVTNKSKKASEIDANDIIINGTTTGIIVKTSLLGSDDLNGKLFVKLSLNEKEAKREISKEISGFNKVTIPLDVETINADEINAVNIEVTNKDHLASSTTDD